MMNKLTTQGETIKDLYDRREDLARNNIDLTDVDSQIDKVLGRVTLHKRNEKIVDLFNGVNYEKISKGGIFESEHGMFKVQDIKDEQIKINGNWHHKAEFEPAIVIKFKGRLKSTER